MENQINRKISSLFPTSFVSSCKFTTVIQNSIVSSHKTHKTRQAKRSSSSPRIIKESTKIVPEFRNPTLFSTDDDSKHTTGPYPRSQKSQNPSSSYHCCKNGQRNEIRGSERCVNVVAKTSRDPYRDFRESMVEMIVEKKIRGAEDLEKLLETFLGLNDAYHHQVILNAFSDICQALFSLESI